MTRWPMATRLLDGLAFSSLLASAIGAALSLVASRALLAPEAGRSALLAGSGAFLIYTLDRLRDADRDRHTSPARTRFIQRHRRSLMTALVVVGLLFGAAWLTAEPAIQGWCAGIGVVGLLHRRLKTHPVLKTGYVSAAWVAGCVGIPWIAAGRPDEGLWLGGSLLAVLVANLIASNLRDGETHPLPARPDTILSVAFAATAVAMTVALLAPGTAVVAGWIALLECLALAGFRADERYGLIVVDGALLVGSLLAWIQLGLLSGS